MVPVCSRCSRSAVYRTREMAARALVPFVLVTDVPSTIRTLLEDLPVKAGPGTQQNHIHGTLLQVCITEQLHRAFQTTLNPGLSSLETLLRETLHNLEAGVLQHFVPEDLKPCSQAELAWLFTVLTPQCSAKHVKCEMM